jgi:hypothetical protein
MSLIFKPKINFSFGSKSIGKKNKTVSREKWHWSTKELKRVVNLRAMGISYKDCAELVGRSQSSIIAAVDSNNLYGAIAKQKESLIIEVMKEYNRI